MARTNTPFPDPDSVCAALDWAIPLAEQYLILHAKPDDPDWQSLDRAQRVLSRALARDAGRS